MKNNAQQKQLLSLRNKKHWNAEDVEQWREIKNKISEQCEFYSYLYPPSRKTHHTKNLKFQ